MNALLVYYTQAAEKQEIDFSIDVALPEDIPIKDTVLCVLLGNLIENACDGCMTLPGSQRHVHLKMPMPNQGSCVFTFDNTFDEKSPKRRMGDFYLPSIRAAVLALILL